MAEHKILPHGSLMALAPNLWQVTGSLSFPLPRNMTVYRLQDGRLVLHSVVAMDEPGMAALEALGTPAIMIVPHNQHAMDAGFYKRRYPELRIICPATERAKTEPKIGATVDGAPEELSSLGIGARAIPAHKFGEYVFDVPVEGGRALILNDLLGNDAAKDAKGFGGFMLRQVAVPGGGFGVPRIVRWVALKDKPATRAFIGELAKTPGVRIVTLSHGQPVTAEAVQALERAATTL